MCCTYPLFDVLDFSICPHKAVHCFFHGAFVDVSRMPSFFSYVLGGCWNRALVVLRHGGCFCVVSNVLVVYRAVLIELHVPVGIYADVCVFLFAFFGETLLHPCPNNDTFMKWFALQTALSNGMIMLSICVI